MTTEREAKLIPGEGFSMPAFDGMPEGAVIVADAVRELDATYYDTPELELARWGITLRYRRGESGRPWTLKLPENESHTTLARDELRFAGGAEVVPDDARDLLRGFLRGNPLTSVARLCTTRVPLHVRDANGQSLVEIVDDSVEVCEGGSGLERFREIEVETMVDNRRSHAALRAAVSALVDAGCGSERPIPKLVRALGERAQQPPSVVVAAVGRHASGGDLIRHLTASSVIQILVHDPGVRLGQDPEAVHLYRVATRRLRADLRTFSRLLDEDETKAIRDELRWLGHAVGPVRDLDVLGARFADHARELPDLDQRAASELLARLASSRSDAHQRLLEVLCSDRYDRTLRTLVDSASAPPIAARSERKAAKPATTLARRLVRRRWDQLADTVDAGGDAPTDRQLHEIRIAAKRCRYAAEAFAPVAGRPARRFASLVEDVQTVLGDYHDAVIAETWLRDAAVELVDCRVAIGGLIARERRARARLRGEWPSVWHRASRRKERAWL